MKRLLLIGMLACVSAAVPAKTVSDGGKREIVVCADPNSLPFSNQAEEGFENKIASILARDMGARLRYVWWAQRRGFARNTLNENLCDVWPGVASGIERLETTHPYYRSTFVFVTRADRHYDGLSLDDPRLKTLKIGVQMIGNDATNTPPAHALADRGITSNVRGYMLYGDYRTPNPAAAIVSAVAKGDIDVALVWGPLAGYFSGQSATPLRLQPVPMATDSETWPMSFNIAMGVRKGDTTLRDELDRVLDRDRPQIEAILREYRIQQAPLERAD